MFDQQVVVDAFDPSLLVSGCATRVFDFSTISESELHDFEVPLQLTVAAPCTVHGIATWFDVLFNGTTVQRWLSTAPGLPTTHWWVALLSEGWREGGREMGLGGDGYTWIVSLPRAALLGRVCMQAGGGSQAGSSRRGWACMPRN